MSDILAKRYAKALLLLGLEDGKHQLYGQELEDFYQALSQAENGLWTLSSPAIPANAKSKALDSILAASDLSVRVKNFLLLLLSKSRFNILKKIVSSYKELCDEQDGIIRGVLTAASSLTDSQISSIKGALGTLTGAKVELSVVVEPKIIGGLVARLGDLVVDSSLLTQLDRVSRLMTSS
ncbi:MAG: ATP synthase F1 subunit delta [Deltaproteobacteria bacterium]|jgi:F-type H+-transporting ATPase subunit delta|nr:ATP synthase F1 subunit delta [Deltaproteobacteria bacterium]